MATATVPETKALSNPADAVEARLQAITEMLVYGASHQEILALVQKQWGVSHRTAQDDLHTVRQRLTSEAAAEDHLFSLRVAQLQRDKLVGLVLRSTHGPAEDFDPKVVQALASLLTAVRGLLDSRDRTAAEIQQLVEERIRVGAKVVPVQEAPSPAAPANGHTEAAVSCANGKGRVRRGHRRIVSPRAAGEANGRAAVSPLVLRPPLPTGDAAATVSAGCEPNYCIDQKIESESEEAVAAAWVCAGCAGDS
jgi:hypothetical protein